MTIAMRNLVESEKWRKAGVTTFYRKTLVLATVVEPGISTEDLAKVLGTNRGCIYTAVCQLIDLNLLRKEVIKPATWGDPKRTKVYPTPYAKDLANIIETV